jgi:DNA-binding HxlR family transcriptional regulator
MSVNSVSQTQIEPARQGHSERAPCEEVCPNFHAAIELIGKRWTGAILCALTERPMRYGELGKAVPGLSDRLLSQRLRELEDEGLVEREVEAGTPVRVTYSLTETGEALGPAIREL